MCLVSGSFDNMSQAFFIPFDQDGAENSRIPSPRPVRKQKERQPLQEMSNLHESPIKTFSFASVEKRRDSWMGNREQDMLKLKVTWLRNQLEMKVCYPVLRATR